MHDLAWADLSAAWARSQGRAVIAARLDAVAAWRETPCYTSRERAALARCEVIAERPCTRVGQQAGPGGTAR